MKIYLIRHGQTDWNIQGKIQGSHDIPLNETGREQARLLAIGMASRPVRKIFSSTLKRAVETARMIGESQSVDIYLAPGLMEVEFGKWEGMTWDEIKEQYPAEYERWNLNPVDVAPPGGETQADVLKRVASSIEAVMGMTDKREDIAIVTHGATMAYIVAYLMRNHPEESEIIVENASITTINYNPLTDDYMLLDANDTSHLKEACESKSADSGEN